IIRRNSSYSSRLRLPSLYLAINSLNLLFSTFSRYNDEFSKNSVFIPFLESCPTTYRSFTNRSFSYFQAHTSIHPHFLTSGFSLFLKIFCVHNILATLDPLILSN